MLEIIKEIGIFIVIAQAVLYFVPGESYVKYVKVIIGIIMIAKIAQPVFALTSEKTFEDILAESQVFTQEMSELEKSYEKELRRLENK